jgi:hypothetical protein
MPFESALIMMKSKREKVNPNAGFVKQLKLYEEECRRVDTTSNSD